MIWLTFYSLQLAKAELHTYKHKIRSYFKLEDTNKTLAIVSTMNREQNNTNNDKYTGKECNKTNNNYKGVGRYVF